MHIIRMTLLITESGKDAAINSTRFQFFSNVWKPYTVARQSMATTLRKPLHAAATSYWKA